MERIIGIIPARMGSTRFPGKPLAPILGRPMIEHVFRRAKTAKLLDSVYVATCDEEIKSLVERFGGHAIMTANTHERASDRVAEAAELVDLAAGYESDMVVMIQGDEPMITAGMIEAAVKPMLLDTSIPCVNLITKIHQPSDRDDLNTIKVVRDKDGDALYFSRAPIPYGDAGREDFPVFKQVCVIPFRRAFLREFSRLTPTPLEKAESIDMLRALEHGRRIHLVETSVETHAVDTLEDLRLVETLMAQDNSA